MEIAISHWLLVGEVFLLGLPVRVSPVWLDLSSMAGSPEDGRVSLGWPLAMLGKSFLTKMAANLFQQAHRSHSPALLSHSTG